MQILVVWKESLKFFEKKNLSQMGLVTLKAVVQSSKAIYLFMLAALAVMIVVLARTRTRQRHATTFGQFAHKINIFKLKAIAK
jgi:hypothetical protein